MEETTKSARTASVIASTAIALACGTNYAFSAWGPEFGKRMQISNYDTNVIGVSGNMGMYAMGIPAGILVDRKGPRWGVAVGSVALALGYFPIQAAYTAGPGSASLNALSFCSFLTGMGSCTSFSAAIKTATYNWPDHRGTATAFPLSGFGLSAFFFATIASLAFGDNIADFLLLLSIGTLCLCLGSLPFMSLIPSGTEYSSVPSSDEIRRPRSRTDPVKLQRTRSASSANTLRHGKPSPRPSVIPESQQHEDRNPESSKQTGAAIESSPLMSNTSSDVEDGGNLERTKSGRSLQQGGLPQQLEITGFKILQRLEFWQLFSVLALLAGIGLMTINNIGNNVKALIRHWDPKATPGYVQRLEQLHVSVISLGSFLGRLLSGIGSDYLVKKLHASRFWCLVTSAAIFVIAQVFALNIHNPHLLWFVSSLTGLAYGALFGVYPALTADTFGVLGLSLNWGLIILAPVISSNIFNLYYGYVYDDHSHVVNDGTVDCPDGIDCYQLAYNVTTICSCVALILTLWCVRYQRSRSRNRSSSLRFLDR